MRTETPKAFKADDPVYYSDPWDGKTYAGKIVRVLRDGYLVRVFLSWGYREHTARESRLSLRSEN